MKFRTLGMALAILVGNIAYAQSPPAPAGSQYLDKSRFGVDFTTADSAVTVAVAAITTTAATNKAPAWGAFVFNPDKALVLSEVTESETLHGNSNACTRCHA